MSKGLEVEPVIGHRVPQLGIRLVGVELADPSDELAGRRLEAPTALALPTSRDGAGHDNTTERRLDHHVHIDSGTRLHTGMAHLELGDRAGELQPPPCAWMLAQHSHPDDKASAAAAPGHSRSWSNSPSPESQASPSSPCASSPGSGWGAGTEASRSRPARTVLSVRSSTISKPASFWST